MWSNVAHLSGLALQFVAELRVGDADQLPGSLADAGAAELGDAVLGYDAIYQVLERGDRGAGMQLGDDAGDRLVGRRRVQQDERLAVLGEYCAPREVWLAPEEDQ